MAEKVLEIWVVYDHPRDHPDFYIVRRQVATNTGAIQLDGQSVGFRDLATAQAWLQEKGLTRLDRYPDDDPVILETWL